MNDFDPSQPTDSDDPTAPMFAQPLRTEAQGSPQPPVPDEAASATADPVPVEPGLTDSAADAGHGAPESMPETIAPPAMSAIEPVVHDTPVAVSDSAEVAAVASAAVQPEAAAVDEVAAVVETAVVADSPAEAVVSETPPQTIVEPAAAVEEPPFIAVEEPIAEAELASDPMLELSLRLADLETAVRGFARRDESGRAAINALHSELGDYKDDFLVRAQAPMLRALVRLLDDIDEMGKSGRSVTSQDLEFLGDQVVEVLESYGAEEIAEQPEVVDGAFQKVLRTMPTEDPARHRRVAAVLRRGWRAHDRLLRPQNVSVYVFSEPVAEQAASDPEAQPAPTLEAFVDSEPKVQPEPATAETASTTVNASVSPEAQAEPMPEPTTEDSVGDGRAIEEESTNV